MMTEDKVLIERHCGFDIFYHKKKEKFVADKEKLKIHFRGSTLFEIMRNIEESNVEEVDKLKYIKSGYFGRQISKINLLTVNKKTKRCKYTKIESTEKHYEIGVTRENEDLPKMFPINKTNTGIYNKVKQLQNEIENIEKQQREYVSKLK